MDVGKRGSNDQKLGVRRDQLITIEDLEIFKSELLAEIREIFRMSSSSPAKKWLRSSEVKKLLGISTGTLQNLRINGTLSCSKVGGTMFYDYDEIVKALQGHAQH